MRDALRQLSPLAFPQLLKEITDPPEKLYLRGTLPSEDNKFLCVVGSRRFSAYGKDVCEKLIAGLSGLPIVIVSGLALGIDSIAHRAALKAGLQTIAVPGSGLKDSALYPPTHKILAHEILGKGGALISEFEPDFHATPWSFPQRNRIMAGLSDAVLVVEAERVSGTLITSRLATEYNRDVLTVPGSIFSKTSEGPHMLLRLGATPITTSAELLEALDFKTEVGEETVREIPEDCTDEEKQLLTILAEPMPRDTLIRELKLPTQRVNILLSLMEIKGLIKESQGEIHRA